MSDPQFVYVVVGTEGEYSERTEWIAGVFQTEEEARHLAIMKLQEELAEAAIQNPITNAWIIRARDDRDLFPGPGQWDLEKAEAKYGPYPEYIDPADDYTVVKVPFGQWGRYPADD